MGSKRGSTTSNLAKEALTESAADNENEQTYPDNDNEELDQTLHADNVSEAGNETSHENAQETGTGEDSFKVIVQEKPAGEDELFKESVGESSEPVDKEDTETVLSDDGGAAEDTQAEDTEGETDTENIPEGEEQDNMPTEAEDVEKTEPQEAEGEQLDDKDGKEPEAEGDKPDDKGETLEVVAAPGGIDEEAKVGEDAEEQEEAKELEPESFRKLSGVGLPKDAPRVKEQEEHRLSGDFTVKKGLTDFLGTVGSKLSFASYHGSEEEEEPSVEEEVEEEEEPIDREYYLERYTTLKKEHDAHRRKNNFLHRKMAEYFKKRKMEHVLRESDQQVDTQQKYNKKLDSLGELKQLDTRQRNTITAELDDIRNIRATELGLLNANFLEMQNREMQVGTGLINTKTGKEIPEKQVERLLKRQKSKWHEVTSVRVSYIKIRDKVTEKQTALKALDNIGDNLHLIDYEQLKIVNQTYLDKIEERDEELTKLRLKCRAAVQCLAHLREKSAAITLDSQEMQERVYEAERECTDVREQLNNCKQARDGYRSETAKLKEASGLLIKPKLLRDMEDALEEIEVTSREMANLEAENARLKVSLQAIKQHVLNPPSSTTVVKKPSGAYKRAVARRIYRGRPSLINPVLPEANWSIFTPPL